MRCHSCSCADSRNNGLLQRDRCPWWPKQIANRTWLPTVVHGIEFGGRDNPAIAIHAFWRRNQEFEHQIDELDPGLFQE